MGNDQGGWPQYTPIHANGPGTDKAVRDEFLALFAYLSKCTRAAQTLGLRSGGSGDLTRALARTPGSGMGIEIVHPRPVGEFTQGRLWGRTATGALAWAMAGTTLVRALGATDAGSPSGGLARTVASGRILLPVEAGCDIQVGQSAAWLSATLAGGVTSLRPEGWKQFVGAFDSERRPDGTAWVMMGLDQQATR